MRVELLLSVPLELVTCSISSLVGITRRDFRKNNAISVYTPPTPSCLSRRPWQMDMQLSTLSSSYRHTHLVPYEDAIVVVRTVRLIWRGACPVEMSCKLTHLSATVRTVNHLCCAPPYRSQYLDANFIISLNQPSL